MEITIGKFKVKPYQNGLCWEIWELRQVKNRKTDSATDSSASEGESWQFTGKYPSTLEAALQSVYELSLKRNGTAGNLKDAMREARQICEEIKRAAKGAR